MNENRSNEAALIGSLMRDPSSIDTLRDLLSPSDFSWHCYAWAWEAMENLRKQGLTIDSVTLGDELERMGKLGQFYADDTKVFSGRAALSHLRSEANPRAIESYAANILDYSAKQQIQIKLTEGARWAANGRRAEDIRNDLVRNLSDIRTYESKSVRHTQKLGEAVSDAYDHTDAAAGGKIEFVMTGLTDLDYLLGGIAAPDLLVVAGRPGMGKTAFLVSLAKNIASCGKRVAFFTLEMANRQIAMRLLAQESGVSYDKQKGGKLEGGDWGKYTHAVEVLSDFSQYSVYLNDLPSIKPSQMRRELMRLGGVDIAIVDYIGLADADGKYESRALEVSAITKGLKSICKEFNIPILAAAQLSRAVEMRANKKPVLSDLKESGGIEENSDTVMFIYRSDEDQPNIIDLIVAKHRNGKVGTISLAYLPEMTRFEDLYKPKGAPRYEQTTL